MKMLFTGGLGDFITVDAFLTQTERDSVTEFALASRSAEPIKKLIEDYKIFPNAKVKVFFDDWSRFFAFVDFRHIVVLNGQYKLNLDLKHLGTCVDYNIINIFPEINKGERGYTKSSLLKDFDAGIKMPLYYGVINPYSPSDRQDGKRDFTKSEWDNVIKNIEKLGIPFYVINTTYDFVPEHPLIINKSKQTNISESVEILKKANWYIGIDSWMPALYSKFCGEGHGAIIKTRSSHYVQYLNIYLKPLDNFSNVHCGLDYFKL